MVDNHRLQAVAVVEGHSHRQQVVAAVEVGAELEEHSRSQLVVADKMDLFW